LARTRADVQAKHAEGQHTFGVDGDTGKVVDMKTYGLLESASVKIQTLKTAIEVRAPLFSPHPASSPLRVLSLTLTVRNATSAGG
jgi:hypothetical protein